MTLLEILAASAMLAVFFVGVYGVVWNTITLRRAIEERALPFSVGPVVMQQIVRDLESAEYESMDPAKECFKASGDREEDVRVDFVAAVPSRDRFEVHDEWVRSPVNEVGYRLRRSEDRPGLYALYRREDMGVDDEPTEGGKYYKVCDGVRLLRLDWFAEDPGEPGSDDADGKPEWDAKKEGKLPWACRVTLVLVGPGEPDDDLPPPEWTFQQYVAFRSRFDKPESAPANPQPGR